MHFKSWPYWLRGGVVGVLLSLAFGVVFALAIAISTLSDHSLDPQGIGIMIVSAPFSLVYLFNAFAVLLPLLGERQIENNLLFGLLLSVMTIAEYGISGLLIGYLYGKIKNRKQPTA